MLEVRSLEKSFGPKQVLFGIDFQARAGRILGLVGKNGAGKTTIFHSILRFLDYSGEIRFEGQAIEQMVRIFVRRPMLGLAICLKNAVLCLN